MALWGAFEGVRTWRRHQQNRTADRGVDRAAGWEPAELRKADADRRGLRDRGRIWIAAAFRRTPSRGRSGDGRPRRFVARASADLESLISRLAKRHTGWLTRWRYEILLLLVLGVLLYRGGKNFFYDSWLAPNPTPVFGLEFYASAGFWLLLWCLVLLWGFCSRLRRGLRGEIARLAAGWNDHRRCRRRCSRPSNAIAAASSDSGRISTRFGKTSIASAAKWRRVKPLRLRNAATTLAVSQSREFGDRSHLLQFPSQALPNRRQPLGQLPLEAAIGRAIILALDAEIILGGDALGGIVGVLVSFAVAEPLCAGVVRIAEMHRHRQQAALAHVGTRLTDADRGGVRFRRTGQVRDRLGERQLALGQSD